MSSSITIDFDRSHVVDPVFGWSLGAPPVFEVPPLDDRVRLAAIRAWTDRARSEYIGVMLVRKLHGLLVDLNAPMDLQELALKMLLEEQRHANLCVAAVRALGGAAQVTFDVPELQQARSAAPLEQQLIEMLVCTFACGEVVAMALVRHAIRALPDSGFRTVLRSIARDEVLHARFGPALLASIRAGQEQSWLDWPGDAHVVALFAAQRRWMLTRDVVEPDEAALFASPEAAAALLSVGVPESLAFTAAYRHAIEHTIPRAVGAELAPPSS